MFEAPADIDADVRRILKHMQLPPESVRSLDVRSMPTALELECFENVRMCVEQRGGSALYGWLIWRWPGVLVEAEFHCVWQSASGELEEVTPRPDGDTRVLFVADPDRTYAGISLDNVRVPLRDDKLVRDFIRAFELKFEVLNRGERAKQHGLVSVSAAEIEPILDMAALTEQMLLDGLSQHSRCICGSGLKYRKCHGTFF